MPAQDDFTEVNDLAVFGRNAERGQGNVRGTNPYSVYEAANYAEPTLLDADPARGSSTAYYAAYTNDGDFAGAVMAQPGQKLRLRDGKTGEVVVEGVGPEGAKTITQIANGVSQSRGRKAAWVVEIEGPDGGWQTAAMDLKDPKNGLLGKLADIALPVLGAVLAPLTGGASLAMTMAGAAGGSALSSALQGRSLTETLMRAGISGLGAGVGASLLGGAAGGAGSSAAGGGASGAAGAAGSAAGNAAGLTAAQLAVEGLGTVAPVIITAGGSGLGAVAGSAAGAAAGGVAGGAVAPSAGGNGVPANGVEVDPVIVTPATGGDPLAVPIVGGAGAVGVGAGAGAGGAGGAGGQQPTEVEGIEVSPPPETVPPPVTGVPLPGPTGPLTTPPTTPPTPPANNPQVPDWLKDLVPLLPILGGGVSGNGGGGGTYTVPTGDNAPGKPGSLTPIFKKPLPAPTSNITNRTPRAVNVDWLRYGEGPEQSFFNNVPAAVTNLPTPMPNADGSSNAPGYSVEDWLDAVLGADPIVNPPAPTQPTPPVTNIPQPAPPAPATPPAAEPLIGGMTPDEFAVFREKIGVPDNYPVEVTGPNNPFEDHGWRADDAIEAIPSWMNYDGNGNLINLGVGEDLKPVNFYEGWQEDTNLPVKVDKSVVEAGWDQWWQDNAQKNFDMNNEVRRQLGLEPLTGPAPPTRPADWVMPMARGGEVDSYAVFGAGDGREDKIEARLSDGEYVIDAETVALLGNGSSKAGAAKLDEFRVNIRKHKGRELAKGKFSADAKPAHAYLKDAA